jgi:hypothetical protein
MGGYCGCATTAAKIRWASVPFLCILGVGLLISAIVEVSKCQLCFSDGTCSKDGWGYQWSNGEETLTDSDGTVIYNASENPPIVLSNNFLNVPCCWKEGHVLDLLSVSGSALHLSTCSVRLPASSGFSGNPSGTRIDACTITGTIVLWAAFCL